MTQQSIRLTASTNAARPVKDWLNGYVIGVGVHPNGKKVVYARAYLPELPGWPLHVAAIEPDNPTDPWPSVKLTSNVQKFLGSATPGTREKVSGRWWTCLPYTDAPPKLVYQ